MRIKSLTLKNIGPFHKAKIDFIGENELDKPPVTIITGENATGKTIILDAIRGLFLGQSNDIERNIVRDVSNFELKAELHKLILHNVKSLLGDELTSISANKLCFTSRFDTNTPVLSQLFYSSLDFRPRWIVNYWTSKLSTDNFQLTSLVAPKPERYLIESLSGIHKNIEMLQLICFFDYLKSSDNPQEKKLGEYLFDILKKIIKLCLMDGEFKYVERKTLTPIVSQAGKELSLDKLSSGNLYLIQRLVALLGQMYSAHLLNDSPLEELCLFPGLLMIDEAENHLHPKWQKTFFNSVLEIFPNLQIIATTHSPFIVSSVKNARIYVCESQQDHAIVVDKTEEYSNKPVEEILLSPVFNTHLFNYEITQLLIKRKQAAQQGDDKLKLEIENKLKSINPDYFSYFDLDELLTKISK